MSSTKQPVPMKIDHMGECTNLWVDLGKSPQCVIGGFTINLAKLRLLARDDATPSVDLNHFLDGCLYVADDSKNPNNLSVSELYAAQTDIDVIFDPLRSIELDWHELDLLMRNQNDRGSFSSIDYAEVLDQMETRIALFANRPLQNRLVRKLREKQKDYFKGWVHFRQRIRDFWSIAYEVCLDKAVVPSSPDGAAQPEPAHADPTRDMLDWIYLANEENMVTYRKHLWDTFEAQLFLTRTLNDIDTLLVKINDITGSRSRGRKRPAHSMDTIREAVLLIFDLWTAVWSDSRRTMLDNPLAENFRKNMNVIEEEILRLTKGGTTATPRAIAATTERLHGLVLTALESWKQVVAKQPRTNLPKGLRVTQLIAELDEVISVMKQSVLESSTDTSAASESSSQ